MTLRYQRKSNVALNDADTERETEAKSLREDVLDLLSDEEVARVMRSEFAPYLAQGEEYLDLQQLERGVQEIFGPINTTGCVLPRKSVGGSTWMKILTRLAHPALARPSPSA